MAIHQIQDANLDYTASRIRSDGSYTEEDYDFEDNPITYDDDFMRQAERDLQENWDDDWRLLDNNCHNLYLYPPENKRDV